MARMNDQAEVNSNQYYKQIGEFTMRGLFNMDGPVWQALGRLADLVILNLFFVITCIPIVTIGAATTALYSVTLKMVKDEDSYILKGYWKAFKENFRQSTIMWLVMLVTGIVLYMDFRIVSSMTASASKIYLVLLLAITLVMVMGILYIFPLQAKFYNTIKGTIKNAFLMALANLPYTAIITVITIGSIILTFINGTTLYYGLLIWLLIGFSIIAHLNSRFFMKVFDPYIEKLQVDDTASSGDISEEFSTVFKNLTPQELPEEDEEKDQ